MDGDIIHAHNDIYLLWQHTQRIADHRKESGGFFKPLNCMACKMLETIYRYKFERVSVTEIKRIRLSDMREEILSEIPNTKNQVVHVPEYIARRKVAGKKPMFGTEEQAIWFGGRITVTLADLSTLWTNTITPETGLLEADHKQARSYSTHFLRRHLVIVTTDFGNARRGILESRDIDETDPDNPVFIAERKHKIDWRADLSFSAATVARIDDRSDAVQVRRDLPKVDETVVVKIKAR